VTKWLATGCTEGAAGGSCGLVKRATSANDSMAEGERLCPRGCSGCCDTVGGRGWVEGVDWGRAALLKVGESGSHSGETGDEERAEAFAAEREAKVPLGCGGRLKVERDRGARGVIEAMSSRW
jgi:hypothetical protein